MPGRDATTTIVSDEMLDLALSEMTETFEGCYPITSEETSEAEYWLEVAADGGPVDAMIGFGAMQRNDRQALEILNRAWSLGSMDSLIHLSERHRSRFENNVSMNGNIEAYIAYYAYATLHEQLFLEYGDDPGEIVDMHNANLEKLGRSISGKDREYAAASAVQLIRGNKNCCSSRLAP